MLEVSPVMSMSVRCGRIETYFYKGMKPDPQWFAQPVLTSCAQKTDKQV